MNAINTLLSAVIIDILKFSQMMIQTAEEAKKRWNQFATIYDLKDSVNLTFYYTLVNMLKITEAQHILEVGCGTGKMLPYTLANKPLETTYLATDLCESMLELTQKHLKQHLKKLGVEQSLPQWLSRHNLTIKLANADEQIETAYKFDRIIVNLVIQLAQDPVRMLKNLNKMGEKGCLMGISSWGNPKTSNFFNILAEATIAKGDSTPKKRSNFHLYGKLAEVAEQAGWEVIVRWQQNAPFSFTSIDNTLLALIGYFTKGDEFLTNFYIQRVKQIFSKRQTLNFSAQLAILIKR